ncbi:MAG: ATP-binding cassette domain-containing protein [Acidimicrobiales bacterium]|nr:ATP-binding cassette domain-containing protein [Acidimicrobiales bacterium]
MIELLGIELSQQSVVIGLITGLTYAALAAGFVLVYRSTGVLNFAHGEMGVFGLAIFVMMIVNYGVAWWLAFFLAIAATALIGMLVELIVVRRLFTSPRLVLLIATIGVGQILTLSRVSWIPDINAGGTIPTAFTLEWNPTDDLRLQAREITVLIVVPILVALLGLFMTRTRFGLAVRASADNPDTARVYGSSPRRVSTIVWTIAGAFSAATAILTAPLQGLQAAAVDDTGNLLVEELLLKVLVVSLLARMRSLPGVIWAGLAVGLVENIVRNNVESTNQSIVNVWFFVTVLVVVLWFIREGKQDGWSLSPPSRPIPERLRTVWWVRNLNRIGFAMLFGTLAVIPIFVTTSAGILIWTEMLLFAMVALSLTILTGWGGQLSLGQFAFVGLGALCTLAFTKGHDIPIPFDLFDASVTLPWGLAVIAAVSVGIVAALLIGLPALRVRGLFLAVTTLAFAVAASSWLFTQDFFTGGTTAPRPARPPSFLGMDFSESRRSLYLLCLLALMLTAYIAARIRSSGVGRTLIAVRDNEDMAAASTVSPARAKLTAFAVAGGICALAGSLFVIVQPSLSPAQQFAPAASVRVIVMAILGGLGSIAGPILGSLWILGVPELTPEKLRALQQLFTSNIGLLVLLMYFPGGLLQIVHNARDALLGMADRRFAASDREVAAPSVERTVPTRVREPTDEPAPVGPALSASGITVRFGGNVAVDSVDFHVNHGELVGLIGTNGAGKSTLLNAVSGFVPAEGRVEVLGADVSGRSAAARHKLGLGRGFQAARLYPELTVREALMVSLEARQRSLLLPSMTGLPPSPGHERSKKAEAGEIIDYLGLGRYADQVIGALSTGTRRIVELGSLLAVDARVLLLDEPTGGVAQRETEAFGPLIKRIQEELEAAVVVIEHDMPLVMGISDRVYCLESGAIIAEGEPDDVRNDPLVIASYLGTDERAIQRSGTAGTEPGTATE